MEDLDIEQIISKEQVVEESTNNNNATNLEENSREISENEQMSQNECINNDEGVVKIILLAKKVKLRKNKFDEEEIMVDAVANKYAMIKG